MHTARSHGAPFIFVSVLLACIGVSGCFPEFGSYYSPSGPVGVPIAAYCHGSIGAKNSMEIHVHGAKIIVSVFELADGVLRVDMQTFTSADASVDFHPEDSVVYGEDSKSRLAHTRVNAFESTTQPGYSAYWFDIDTAPRELLITLPNITVDGQRVQSISVRFTRKHGVWLGVINC